MMCAEKNVFEFNESGLLPKDCYEITLEEIKKYFVDNFPESTTRSSRFTCFLEFSKFFLENFSVVEKGLIFGGFITNKMNPFDIDLLFVLNEKALEYPINMYLYNLEQNVKSLKDEYLDLDDEQKWNSNFYYFGCDFHYLHHRSKDNKELYEDYLKKKEYWCKWVLGKNNFYVSFPIFSKSFEEILCASVK